MNGGSSLRDLMHRVEQKYFGTVDEMDSFSVNFHTKNTFKVNYSICGGWEEVLERLTPKVGVDTYIFTRYIRKSPPRNYRDTKHHEDLLI